MPREEVFHGSLIANGNKFPNNNNNNLDNNSHNLSLQSSLAWKFHRKIDWYNMVGIIIINSIVILYHSYQDHYHCYHCTDKCRSSIRENRKSKAGKSTEHHYHVFHSLSYHFKQHPIYKGNHMNG